MERGQGRSPTAWPRAATSPPRPRARAGRSARPSRFSRAEPPKGRTRCPAQVARRGAPDRGGPDLGAGEGAAAPIYLVKRPRAPGRRIARGIRGGAGELRQAGARAEAEPGARESGLRGLRAPVRRSRSRRRPAASGSRESDASARLGPGCAERFRDAASAPARREPAPADGVAHEVVRATPARVASAKTATVAKTAGRGETARRDVRARARPWLRRARAEHEAAQDEEEDHGAVALASHPARPPARPRARSRWRRSPRAGTVSDVPAPGSVRRRPSAWQALEGPRAWGRRDLMRPVRRRHAVIPRGDQRYLGLGGLGLAGHARAALAPGEAAGRADFQRGKLSREKTRSPRMSSKVE